MRSLERDSLIEEKNQRLLLLKRSIRKEVLAKRDALSAEDRQKADIYMADRIIGHQWFYRAEVVLTFVNYGSEISTREVIEEALRKGKQVFVPRIEKSEKSEVMEFYRITSMEQLQEGYKGILEPDGTTERFDYEVYKEARTLLLMPGVAFDKYGNRMGYGKGFYDRFLANKEVLQTYSIGIGYACQRVSEVPVDEYDKKPYQVILA